MNTLMRITLLSVAVTAFAAVGCHRSFYREQADLQAYDLIAEKATHPHWDLEEFVIDPNPTSRMASLDSPDCPPMPPDDPVAHDLMHYVDDKPGYPFWHVNGDTMFIENPEWRTFLPLDEDGVLRVDSNSAVQLALLHSPNYQTQLETLYLSALDVSAERFAFDPQHFGGYELEYDAFGRLHPSAGGAATSVYDASTRNIAVTRAFTTGATLVAGLANSLIWRFGSGEPHVGSTLIDFTFVQPLLQGAGRDRIMESLTLSERNLLYGVRQMERYRRGFYLDIVMGNGVQAGPRRSGGALGGNFSAQAGGAGGLLGLLQTQFSIANQEANLDALRSSLTQLEALSRKGSVQFQDVDRTRQQVTQQSTSLINRKRAYRDRLDAFKRSLGLPPTLDVEIDDNSLDPVNLTDPKIRALQDQIKELRFRVSAVNIALLDEFRKGAEFGWTPELIENLRKLKEQLAELDAICMTAIETTTEEVRLEINRLRETLPKRQQLAVKMQQLIKLAKESGDGTLFGEVDPTVFDTSQLFGLRKLYDDQTQREISLDELPDYLEDWLDDSIQRLRGLIAGNAVINDVLDNVLQNGPNMEPMQLKTVVDERIQKVNPDQFSRAEAGIIELLLISALARAESVMLPEVELTAEEAVEIARLFRRDWMNARASLVDTWRLIQFSANDLESILDIVFNGDIRNRGDNPLRLRDSAGTLGVGVQFDAPLTRLLERNSYRESLVRFQAARRSYYQIDDEINQSMRSLVRQVQNSQVDFEIQRTALRIAVARVRSARATIEQPPRPGVQRLLDTTASLNLIDALGALNGAQDAFIGVWVDYQVQRGLLDLQMGTMQLDELGLWIDPGPIGPSVGYPSEERLQAIPEYTHGLPSLDDLLYRRGDDEPMYGPEVLPTPAPNGDGIEMLPSGDDLTEHDREIESQHGRSDTHVRQASFAAPRPANLKESNSESRNPAQRRGFHVAPAARSLGKRLRR